MYTFTLILLLLCLYVWEKDVKANAHTRKLCNGYEGRVCVSALVRA